MPTVKGVKGFVSKKQAVDMIANGQATAPIVIAKDQVQVELINLKTDFVGNLGAASRRKKIINDFRKPYFPSDNIYQSNAAMTSQDDMFRIEDLDVWMHYSIGVGYEATYGISDDTVKNGFEFITDPDKQDAKAIPRPNITKWIRSSNFLNMLWYWRSFDLGMGYGFARGIWEAKELQKLAEEPPKGPPKKFEIINPRWFMPTGNTLTKSNRLNYDEEVWEFSGGAVNQATQIHKDRVFVLRGHELTGQWRGLSTFDPVKYTILGYFNNVIFVSRGLQNWGEQVPTLFYGNKFPTVTEQRKIMEVLDYYEANGRMQLPEGARFEFKATNLGKGIRDAHEIYVEDLSAMWRIPKNQLMGRSEGGGLTSGPAVISKDDYYERIGGDQIKLSYPVMKNFIWKFFPDSDNLWPRWHMNIYKTDRARLEEKALELDNEKRRLEVAKLRFELKFTRKNQRDIENGKFPGISPGNGGNGNAEPKNGGKQELEKEVRE